MIGIRNVYGLVPAGMIIAIWNVTRNRTGILLFVFAAITGLLNYDQYGISWDEPAQRKTGLINYNYIVSGSKELETFYDRDYGVAFELPLIVAEKIMGFQDSRDIYLLRHLLTHLFFLLSAFFCFRLINLMYGNKLLASIGFLLIVLCPRLYADSFFNSKDIPFAAMFLICFYLNALAFNRRRVVHFLLLGSSIGLLINIRIMGVMLLVCISTFLILDIFIENDGGDGRRVKIRQLLAFFGATLLTIYISCPFLWEYPFKNFAYIFQKNMDHFQWRGVVLFNGQYIEPSEFRWNYLPVWFMITVPVFYLIAGLVSILYLLLCIIKMPFTFLSNSSKRNNIFFLICFLAPVISVIIFKSLLYDGWRHMYFIYPPFVLLAVFGLNILLKTRVKNLIRLILLIFFLYISYFMISNNPFQQVYFNELVDTKTPEFLRKRFELDYWGTSYKQSLEYILKEDDSPIINIAVANKPGRLNVAILPIESRKRINLVDVNDAKYFISNYRFHPEDYTEIRQEKWHAIKVKNNTINEIYKLR